MLCDNDGDDDFLCNSSGVWRCVLYVCLFCLICDTRGRKCRENGLTVENDAERKPQPRTASTGKSVATRGPVSSPMRFSTHCYHHPPLSYVRLSRSLVFSSSPSSVRCTSGPPSCQLSLALLPGVIGCSEHAILPGFRHPKIRTPAPPTESQAKKKVQPDGHCPTRNDLRLLLPHLVRRPSSDPRGLCGYHLIVRQIGRSGHFISSTFAPSSYNTEPETCPLR